MAAALGDDAVDGGEPESGALARRLGREERLEDPRRGFVIHAVAGVTNREHHIGARPEA